MQPFPVDSAGEWAGLVCFDGDPGSRFALVAVVTDRSVPSMIDDLDAFPAGTRSGVVEYVVGAVSSP
jgi:hypothetical protein